MILEVADIRIAPGRNVEFEVALHTGVATVIAQAKGYVKHEIRRGIESRERYLLLITWQTLENHTVDFRGSSAFAQWRAIVGPFFAQPPVVEHFELVE
jgi:heme-degrading monooxygenase HmoA